MELYLELADRKRYTQGDIERVVEKWVGKEIQTREEFGEY